jgi:hypothetical protein
MGMCAFRSVSEGNKYEFHRIIEVGNVEAAKLFLNDKTNLERDAIWTTKHKCKDLECCASFWVLVHMLKYPESDEMLRYVNLIRSISGTDNEDMEALRSTMRDALSEDEKQEIDELEALSKDKSDNIKPGSRSGVQLYSTEKCMGL